MRKLLVGILLICTLTIFTSCRSATASLEEIEEPPKLRQLSGVWRREGDKSEGDIVNIIFYEDGRQPVGILSSVSPYSETFGYKPGDIKWKFIRVNEDGTILINNLNSTLTREEESKRVISIVKDYGPFLITIIDKNLISLQSKDTSDKARIGNTQKWRRIK